MTSLGASFDRWLTTDPREAQAEGTYQPGSPCTGTLDKHPVAPLSLNEDLLRLHTLLEQARAGIAKGVPSVTEAAVDNALRLLTRLADEAAGMPLSVDVECGYDGEVDAAFYGGRSAYTAAWDCPRCDKENEEEREAGDDHPDL